MVSHLSRLFEADADWAIGVPGRPRTESRQQLVLDMSRAEVIDHVTTVLTALLASAPIAYVKWDMNRISPSHSRQRCRPTGRASSSIAPSWASMISTGA